MALCTIYAYLAFHGLNGSQGFMSWMDYKQRQDKLGETLTALQSQRQALEERVGYLKADGLHLDMLDMESRRVLFITKPHEYTIWLDPEL